MAWKEEKGQDSDGQLENTQHPACGCHGLLLLPGSCLSCLAARCCSLAVARRKVCGLPQGRVEQGLCSAFSLPRETSGKSFFPAAGGFISSSEVSCSGSAPLLLQVFTLGLNFHFSAFTHEVVPTLSIPGTPRQLPGFGPVGSPLGCVSLCLFLKNCRLPPPNCFRSPTQPRSSLERLGKGSADLSSISMGAAGCGGREAEALLPAHLPCLSLGGTSLGAFNIMNLSSAASWLPKPLQ